MRLSPDVPSHFDAPLAPHHKIIGAWAASRDPDGQYSRREARARIERLFDIEVMANLASVDLMNLQVEVFIGADDLPPAIVVICGSMGQIDLGWIEKKNTLSETLCGYVAPVAWRASAYQALVACLCGILPIFGFEELIDEMAGYFWDGETTDEGARKALVEWHGHDPEDVDGMVLPSQMLERRPDFMLAENAGPLKALPAGLRKRLRRLTKAAEAVRAAGQKGNAWWFDFTAVQDYLPDIQDCSHLPPMTLVPVDEFLAEVDEVCRHGMEYGFMDLAGLCPLDRAADVDAWFASLKLGVELMLAAQDLIDLDPLPLRNS